MRLFAAMCVLAALAGPARAAGFWERVADPDRETVERLVERAQGELDGRPLGGVSPEGAARALAMLDEALRLKPAHFLASVLRGEALAAGPRPGEAIPQLGRACALAQTSDDEAWCTLRLAVEESKAGRYAQALLDYDRHVRVGGASATVYTNAAELLMALGRLPESQERYREAIRLEEGARPGPEHDQNLALAHYGLAVALDRDDEPTAAREVMARAVALDPKLELLDAARDGHSGVFFVPRGDVFYYRGLALEVLARGPEAAESFRQFEREQPGARWKKRLEGHLRALGEKDEPPRARGAAWRVVAAATVKAEGPLPAPLIDAAWKSQPRLLDPCFEGAAPLAASTIRLGIDLVIDGKGALTKVTASPPPEWKEVPACLEDRLRGGLRLPRPSRPAATSARIELVLAIRS
jgi:tetratricopeptide (TPR) repeat protein